MAGGKETPRQKLIGMMYLVLTALLALQVSSAIILKFKFLDDSLMGVNSKTAASNAAVPESIQKAVAKLEPISIAIMAPVMPILVYFIQYADTRLHPNLWSIVGVLLTFVIILFSTVSRYKVESR